MLKVQEIRELIKLLDSTSVSELSYEENGCKIKLRKGVVTGVVAQEVVQAPVVVPQVQAAPVKVEAPKAEEAKESANINDETLHKIVSPMVGTFYAAPSPDEDDYAQVGAKVNPDSVVCIVEAMKLFNEIEAEVKGEIVEILAKNGQLVEYGQPLFLVKAE